MLRSMVIQVAVLGAFLFQFCYAQDSTQTFTWGFSDTTLSNLPSCSNIAISVKNVSTSTQRAVPPFYMQSVEIGGLGSTTLIGSGFNLSWQVAHAPGTSLLLSVVDSAGNMGFIPSILYTVVDGDSTACVPKASSSSFVLAVNVTENLSTCQQLGLRITGGRPPYTVTLAALNSPFVTNATMGPNDDVFTYINRASPNGHLVAAVSDLNGQWATGTAEINTVGDSDTSCPGLVSSYGQSADIPQTTSTSASLLPSSTPSSTQVPAAGSHDKKLTIIIGVAAAAGVILLLAIIVGYAMRRRRNMKHGVPKDQEPTPFTDTHSLAGASIDGRSDHSARLRRPPRMRLSIVSWIAGGLSPVDPNNGRGEASGSVSSGKANIRTTYVSGAGFHRPSPSSSRSGPRPSPSLSTEKLSGPVSAAPSLPGSMTTSSSLSPRMAAAPPLLTSNGEDGFYVIQHRDGGSAMVRELPPPYANRSSVD